jgi:hypothetical protein
MCDEDAYMSPDEDDDEDCNQPLEEWMVQFNVLRDRIRALLTKK